MLATLSKQQRSHSAEIQQAYRASAYTISEIASHFWHAPF